MNLISLLILIIILGTIILVHEFGHFISAKKSGVYVEEFSLGMGPKIWGFKLKNDNTNYNLRLFPIGGFVSMANGETDGFKVRKNQMLENKSFIQKLIVLLMGVFLNIILCIILLFVNGWIYGSPDTKPYVGALEEKSPSYKAGLKEGDLILEIEGKKVKSWDEVLIELNKSNSKESYSFKVKNKDNKESNIKITPEVKKEDGAETKTFGISTANVKNYGFVNALKYSMSGFANMFRSIFTILINIFSGQISINNLSGPIGIYTLVDSVRSTGMETLIYLTAYLSMNVAIINLIPIPVFDGGRVLLVIIEKILNKKLNPKIEDYLNIIGFILLVLLTVYIGVNDILRLV